ncbi:hypothetical protein [Erysipelothrix anatis]|uniref:hypothetical protein n=1 Tax=Erysipelothrix anatis TaxID=2683713 RepID=UPI00140C6DF6|nr:hypothetical protein [Erysipelothrix anatis]
MNKYQEAFNKIMPTTSDYELIEATKIIRQLVDKETPMKPVDIECMNNFECGRCGNSTLWKEETDCCCVCGQVVDWTNDEA